MLDIQKYSVSVGQYAMLSGFKEGIDVAAIFFPPARTASLVLGVADSAYKIKVEDNWLGLVGNGMDELLERDIKKQFPQVATKLTPKQYEAAIEAIIYSVGKIRDQFEESNK